MHVYYYNIVTKLLKITLKIPGQKCYNIKYQNIRSIFQERVLQFHWNKEKYKKLKQDVETKNDKIFLNLYFFEQKAEAQLCTAKVVTSGNKGGLNYGNGYLPC